MPALILREPTLAAESRPAAHPARRAKPTLTFVQIWNMCFGFLGLQFAFALQSANVSRIFQSLGADLEQIPILWIAAPLTGLLVQPLIGYCSDRTWTRLGRRKPYFIAGAVLAATALWLMPRAPTLWFAAALLWVLDASINVSMEPFRAFVGDQLAPPQRPLGYAMQSFFIGLGAVVASALPWVLAQFGFSNSGAAADGRALIPDTVRYAFDSGAVVLLLAILWTVVRTREYPPGELQSFNDATPPAAPTTADRRIGVSGRGALWSGSGALGIGLVAGLGLDRQLYLVCVGALAWGIALLVQSRRGQRAGGFVTVMRDIDAMPVTMRRLAPVQFFSWLALFAMWIYTTAAVAQVHFGSSDPRSEAFNQGANWVGILFAAYNGSAVIAAIFIPALVRCVGLRVSHLINLWIGGLALLSFLVIRDPHWLLASMVGIGIAWASILSLPYVLLSDSLPAQKMGLYMGIFNFFIVIPQLVAASVLGLLLKWLFGGAPMYALAVGGVSFLIAGALVLRVAEPAGSSEPSI
jgi:maltose/moltooligosaccharide transporter